MTNIKDLLTRLDEASKDLPMPDSNVGFKIIKKERLPDDYLSVVQGFNPNGTTGGPSYVSWIFNHTDGGFHYGDYTEDFSGKKSPEELKKIADIIYQAKLKKYKA